MSKLSDLKQIKRAFELIVSQGAVTEMRILGTASGVASGYFKDLDKAAQIAAEWSGKAKGVYVTLNPVNPELLARASNRVIKHAKETTKDSDIRRLRWLLVDCDPIRKSGISSTKEEHEAALDLARKIRSELRRMGWPEPVLVDSGNGAHLLYRIILPNDQASSALIQQCLQVMAFCYGNKEVDIDQTTYNASRLWKLPGTLACKGDNTAKRPHRLSRFLKVPDDIKPVKRKQLEVLAAKIPKEPEDPNEQAYKERRNFNLKQWIKKHQISVIRSAPWNDGQKWILAHCPWKPNEHKDQAAFIVQFQNGAISAGCHHNGCAGKNWHDLRELYEPGWKEKHARHGKSIAEKLIEIGEAAELFQDQHKEAYAAIEEKGVRKIIRLKGRDYRRWLARRLYADTGKPANREALATALTVLEAKAIFDGRCVTLENRFAKSDDAFWLDLADERWRAVKITTAGWEIVDRPPILFRRFSHQASLPEPERGGKLQELLPFLNLAQKRDKLLVRGWLVVALLPHIPRPILVLYGPQGSAKTTQAKMLRALVDPSKIESVNLGRSSDELALILDQHAVPFFDNVTWLQRWQADNFCCAVTGTGHTKRVLFTDSDVVIMSYKRALLLTGINVPAVTPDLLDRCLLVGAERVPPEKRREEAKLWEEFEVARPRILGGLLQVLSKAMREYPKIELSNLPRMADFARWGAAVSATLGRPPDDFLKALSANAKSQLEEIIDSDPVAQAVQSLAREHRQWTGTATDLLDELKNYCGQNISEKEWPRRANILTRRLRILLSTLADIGIRIEFYHEPKVGKLISIKRIKSK